MDKYNLTTKNLTVVFDNAFNESVIRNLNSYEYNLLMGLLSRLKRQKLKEVHVDFKELLAFSGATSYHRKELISLIQSMWHKVKSTDYTLWAQNGDQIDNAGSVMLFSWFAIDNEHSEVRLKINPDLQYFANEFTHGHYTSLKLKDFQETKDRYGKALFTLLAQYSHTGFFKIGRDKLMNKLDVPRSYDTHRFNDKVLNKAVINVSPFFANLKVQKIRNGRAITHYVFTFTKQTTAEYIQNKFKQRKNITNETIEKDIKEPVHLTDEAAENFEKVFSNADFEGE